MRTTPVLFLLSNLLIMEICETVVQQFEETWTETIESFVKKVDHVCEDLPWPLDWLCHAVVTVLKIVTEIIHFIIRVVVTVVCYTIAIVLAIAGAIINVVLTIPFLGTWVKALVGGVVWLWSQFIGLFDAGLGLIGIRPIKNLRLHVIILMRPDRTPTVRAEHITLCLDRTSDIFRRRADIKLTITVHQVLTPSVKNALTVDSGFVGLAMEDAGDAGMYFQSTMRDMLFEHGILFSIRIGAPVVVFIVDGAGEADTSGCSAGPAADYVCVEGCFMVTPPQTSPIGPDYQQKDYYSMAHAASTLAHEVCHALGLAHDGLDLVSGDSTNLMHRQLYPNGLNRGDNLSPLQRAIIRSSPHVTYF